MIKKKVIITLCILLTFACLIAIFSKYDNGFVDNGITYALVVDGKKAKEFPTKGSYKVDVDCTNADGGWDYGKWKLNIENITGDVSCNVSFASKSKVNFNDYIINLSNTTSAQTNWKVVNESATIPNYDSATNILQSDYNVTNQYEATAYYSSSGTSVSNVFSYNNNMWSTNSSNMTTGKYYHFVFNIKDEGYYQFCYEISSGNTGNSLRLQKGYNYVSNTISASNSAPNSACINLGYTTSADSYKVIQGAKSDASYGISTIKFSFKKVNNTSNEQSGYRYEGKIPDNYVWFNDELWRIIGVFDSTSHGVANKNLIKIIRDDSIGALAWNNSSMADWSLSDLYKLLNPIEGNSKSGSYYMRKNGTDSGYCYGSSTTKSNCDYSDIGIDSSYREMIKKATWYLGGQAFYNSTTDEFYLSERSNTTVNSITSETQGYIGLAYPSDYGYAVLSSSCARSTTLDSYGTSGCADQNWMYGKGTERTITHYLSVSGNAFILDSSGRVSQAPTTTGYMVRPTLYLNENVYVIDGDGSITNPYIIGMDEA